MLGAKRKINARDPQAFPAKSTTLLSFVTACLHTSCAFMPLPQPHAPRPVGRSRPPPIHSAVDDSDSSNNEQSFAALGLSEALIGVADEMGWRNPTAVQQLSIPLILQRHVDALWCEGPTGTGKTAAFVLPILQILLDEKRPDRTQIGKGFVSTLILCPTRELAAQTAAVIQTVVSHLPKKQRSATSVQVIHGGVPTEPQVSSLSKRIQTGTTLDILVATPGRLTDILKQNDNDPKMADLERRILTAFDEKSQKVLEKPRSGKRRRTSRSAIDSSLSLNDIQEMELHRVDDDTSGFLNELLLHLDYLVLDEADRLLGGEFGMEDLLPFLPPKNRRMKLLLFSATFPDEVETRVGRIISRLSSGVPLRVSTSSAMMQRGNETTELSNRKQKRLTHATPIQSVAKDSAPKIMHRAIRLDEQDRTKALRHLLEQYEGEWDRVLVFVATRYATEHVSKKLRRYGIKSAELHGKLDQDARERRLTSFRTGLTRVLVSTDLAARGLDVDGLAAVIHYDLPRGAADFTHRSGRTARAGNEGTVISFLTASKASHFDVISKKEGLGVGEIEKEVLLEFPPNEVEWKIGSMAERTSLAGAVHSLKGLAHDRMFGGIKGRRKSKKDKLRESAVMSLKEEPL